MADNQISVIGSYAVGMTMKTERFPVAGETVPGHSFALLHGGKGSNQAIACARLGGNVFYYTCLGRDSFGEEAIKLYAEEGVDASQMKFSDSMSTGVGLVTVNKDGENQITIDIGANNDVHEKDIDGIAEIIKKSSLVLMQLELNMDAILHTARLCKKSGIPLLLNPAPFRPMPEEILACCAYFTPNETEARQLLGLAPNDHTANEEIAQRLLARGVKNVVMTLGSQGAMLANADGCTCVAGNKVDVVDSTGAGDTFSAALAVALSEGASLTDAVRFANAAGALSVTKYGVIPSLPYRKDVDTFSGFERIDRRREA